MPSRGSLARPQTSERRDMFNFGRKKPGTTEIRDTLFGDLPASRWPGETTASGNEPWLSFVQARDHLRSGRREEALAAYRSILAIPELESRHYAQSWHFLRENGILPDSSVAGQLFGVVVEVVMRGGLDIVAAYADHTARYFNHSGAAVVWDAPDNSLHGEIENVLRAGKVVVDETGPWEGPRPPAPPRGQVRISMLTPGGIHFGQSSFDALADDRIGGAVLVAATDLMKRLVAKTEKGRKK